ncbi:MAG: aspartate carbamoyltransferase regulatory subunit [archaeon]
MREAIFNRVFGKGFVGRTREQVESNGLWQDIPRNPNKLGKIGKRLLYRLDDGTLIDHIEPGRAEFIKHLLGLGNLDTEIVYPEGLNSHGHGIKKGVLAINQRYLTDQQLSMLGLLTQTATVNIIKERKVVRKGRIILPSVFKGELQCQNHNCITWPDHYEHVTSLFYLEQRDPLRMRCHNCERPIGRGGIADAIEEPIMKSIRQRYHQSCRNGN